MKNKYVSLNKCINLTKKLKNQKKKIVMTNGCFDIIHSGHVDYLTKSKKLGDILIVAVNSDKSVKELKGRSRPINNLKNRIKVLNAISCVDFIISFNHETPQNMKKFYQIFLQRNSIEIWKSRVVIHR